MTRHRKQSAGSGKGPFEKEKSKERESEGVSDDSCRCKEVSKKRLPEMLKLMVSDLAFWRKAKEHKKESQ